MCIKRFCTKKPTLYEETAAPFWEDDPIAKQMLAAHLDPTFDGASRKLEFIKRSPAGYPRLLDVGY